MLVGMPSQIQVSTQAIVNRQTQTPLYGRPYSTREEPDSIQAVTIEFR